MRHVPLPRALVSNLRRVIGIINNTDSTYLENEILTALNPIITTRSVSDELLKHMRMNLTDMLTGIFVEKLIHSYGELGYDDTVRYIASFLLLDNLSINSKHIDLLISTTLTKSISETNMYTTVIDQVNVYIRHLLNYTHTRDGIYMSLLNILNTLTTYRDLNPREVYMVTVTPDGVLLTLGDNFGC